MYLQDCCWSIYHVHGSYDLNLASEILILGGDIRSRSWLNIGDSYGMYNNFALYSNYRYWILVDAWVKKDKHLEIQKNVTFFIS